MLGLAPAGFSYEQSKLLDTSRTATGCDLDPTA